MARRVTGPPEWAFPISVVTVDHILAQGSCVGGALVWKERHYPTATAVEAEVLIRDALSTGDPELSRIRIASHRDGYGDGYGDGDGDGYGDGYGYGGYGYGYGGDGYSWEDD